MAFFTFCDYCDKPSSGFDLNFVTVTTFAQPPFSSSPCKNFLRRSTRSVVTSELLWWNYFLCHGTCVTSFHWQLSKGAVTQEPRILLCFIVNLSLFDGRAVYNRVLSLWPITKHTDNSVNQSKLEENTCSRREARENVRASKSQLVLVLLLIG